MSADDQTFLDVLNAVPRQVKHFSDDIADYVEAHVDKVASTLRETLSHAEWLPESARPRAPQKAYPIIFTQSVAPTALYTRVNRWVMKNKVLTGTFFVGFAGGLYMIQRRKALYHKKRRAKRAGNGARLEAVVIAGSISEPIVRSLALDLERRGFVVFIVCESTHDEKLVQKEGSEDIRPLLIDVTEPHAAMNAIDRFASYLSTPQVAFTGAREHMLALTALLIIPTLTYPIAPLATLSSQQLSDITNTRLLQPMLIAKTFLPLLTTPPATPPSHQKPSSAPQVLFLTPSIIPSVCPAFHTPESTIAAALSAFSVSLSAELSPLGISLTHLKLGAFDTTPLIPKNQLATLSAHSAETRAWGPGAREAYSKNFIRAAKNSIAGPEKGSNLRELHNAVFDVMEGRGGGTVCVGRGARTYALVGAWVPRGLVNWMMGLRKVERQEGSESSRSGSEADLEAGNGEQSGTGSEYINVECATAKEN